MITYRQTTKDDYSALLEILAATLSCSDMIQPYPSEDSSGWLASHNDTPVGIVVANRKEGKLVLTAILPEFTRQCKLPRRRAFRTRSCTSPLGPRLRA